VVVNSSCGVARCTRVPVHCEHACYPQANGASARAIMSRDVEEAAMADASVLSIQTRPLSAFRAAELVEHD